MSDFNDLIAQYVATWNEPDAVRRRAAIAALWTDDARYVDPVSVAEGHGAIDAMIAHVQEVFPGFVLRLTGTIDAHHDLARFAWELGPDGAEAPVAGFDVAVISDDGRLRTIHGFLDRVPSA